jgi:hypothetical protein
VKDGMTDGRKDYLSRGHGRQVADLRWHWDASYEITWNGKFRAKRLRDGAELEADTAAELRELMICDHSEHRVRRPRM